METAHQRGADHECVSENQAVVQIVDAIACDRKRVFPVERGALVQLGSVESAEERLFSVDLIVDLRGVEIFIQVAHSAIERPAADIGLIGNCLYDIHGDWIELGYRNLIVSESGQTL